MLDPNMSAEQLRLHMGEMTAQEVRTARAAIKWANETCKPYLVAGAFAAYEAGKMTDESKEPSRTNPAHPSQTTEK